MDGGDSMQSNEERGAEKMMDDYLKSLGLHRKKIAKDGSCLFRAVAEQVLHCQSLHIKVRAQCVEFLRKNRELYEAFIEGDFEDYLTKLQDPQQWVGEVEINALAVMYKRDFLIFQEPGKPAVNITSNNFKDEVQLCFLNGNHYDCVYPIRHFKSAALCQSLLYELLYDGVFKVDILGQCQRVGRNPDLLSDDNMPACGSSDESDVDTGEALWVESDTQTAPKHNRGRGRRGMHLSERVRRSLNPTLFRNIDYDVWHKTKRAQQKMDYCIAAGMQFSVGDRCKVCLNGSGRSYTATIKQVSPHNGPVTVYIEDLGLREVPLWNLRPPSSDSSWSTVVSRDKRISNGHGEWEERGKGRGRGKHIQASSSAVQATGLGSNGRVQKQHSWPSHTTVDEQGGGKTRRSISTVESSFGLTEQQRLAKEEEERNIALVEIQLRDEQSFPALGTHHPMHGDGGRKKAGDKKRSQRNKMKSPVEDVRAPSPSDGKRPKSATPPLPDTTASTPPTKITTPLTNQALFAAKLPAASPTNTGSSTVELNTNSASVSTSPSLTCATTTAKTNMPSYAIAAAVARPSSPPAAAAAVNTKPSAPGGAVPPSIPSSATSLSFLTPVLPVASSLATSKALSSSSPPPSSSSSLSTKSVVLPPPTFIAPIAPVTAQGFLPPSSLPVQLTSTASNSLSSQALSSSSSSLIHHATCVHNASPVSTQTPNVGTTLDASEALQSQSKINSQVSLPQSQIQIPITKENTQPSIAQKQTTVPQMQLNTLTSLHQSHLPQIQQQSKSHVEVASPPETQIHQPDQDLVSQPQPQPKNLSQLQSDLEQAADPPPDSSYLHTSQPTVSSASSEQLQPSVSNSNPQVSTPQPPNPSQVPHPSPLLSSSSTHPSPQSQITISQNQTETLLPPTQPQPNSLAHVPLQQLPHPSHQQLLTSVHPPPYPQSIPGVVPLQQLSQLYQDPLYPGFPQGEKGSVAPIPPFSSSKSGEDLPQDKNVLRFFFNLGVKAYSMPMFAPYIYLLPLQQTHTMHPRGPSRSPSPTPQYSSSNHPAQPTLQHQEPYSQHQYPSTSVPPQFDQAPVTSQHADSFSSTRYPITEPLPQQVPCPSLPWQQQQIPPPNSSSFPVGYSSPSPRYQVPQTFSQGYHQNQGPGLPLYPTGVPTYPHTSLSYQPSPTRVHEEVQVNQGAMEKGLPTNGDTSCNVPSAMAANLVNTKNRAVIVPGFAVKKEPIESVTGAVLLVDPPLNSKPILVSSSGIKDVPASMTPIKSSCTPGSPLCYDISKTDILVDSNHSRGYQGHQKVLRSTNNYASVGVTEPSQVGYLSTVAQPMSVGCNTNEDWEEETEVKPRMNHRGARRNHRGGGRWRGSHDSSRGTNRRRHEGDAGTGLIYTQYHSSYRGRGRGY